MKKTPFLALAAAFGLAAFTTSANAGTYDFLDAANAGPGQIGESIFTVFNTNPYFTGPNLRVTGTKADKRAFVYFDNGNAGMGVCGKPNAAGSAAMNTMTGGSANLCDPGSDDGLTSTDEKLTFTATNDTVLISNIWINSNHDGKDTASTAWDVNGTIFSVGNGNMFADPRIPGSSDYRLEVNIVLGIGDTLTIFGTKGPDSYISAIEATSGGVGGEVPLPAGVWMLLAGVGALGAARRMKKRG